MEQQTPQELDVEKVSPTTEIAMMQLQIDGWFTYHSPQQSDIEKYAKIRQTAKQLAYTIMECTPKCSDQAEAIRSVRQAVMFANAGIACEGRGR